jgi:hypothetical protein
VDKAAFGVVRYRKSAIYNCFGMVFGGRRTTLGFSQIPSILAVDGFEMLTRGMSPRAHDLAVYRTTDGSSYAHIAVVVSVVSEPLTIRVLSKWGEEGGEYEHELRSCPWGRVDQEIEFWTPRMR